MEIKSESYLVQASSANILTFLSDANNLLHLLPQDRISDWEASTEKCSFKVQGGFQITLIENGNNGSDELYLKSGDGTPFTFDLTIKLKSLQSNETEGYVHFKGDVNMFLKMLVEKPLTALFNYMASQLQAHYK